MAPYYLLGIIFLPFFLAMVPLLVPNRRESWLRPFSYATPTLALALILFLGMELGWNGSRVVEFPLVPALGIYLSFVVDGLSLFFGLLVTGMGVLVFQYSFHYYETKPQYLPRLIAGLTLFMASMLGCVFSNNLIVLFLFWELTGVASFLLIGFYGENVESRRGARMAMIITTFTGLLLFLGIIMLGVGTGTFEWSELSRRGLPLEEFPLWFKTTLFFMMVGAFGKSAQFPFHFWLPNAMAAPTPVSAYLHSATMVKLGVFLTARLYPLFVESELWFPLTTSICFATMLLGGVLALLSNDLKSILAHATISQLGFFIGFYGMGDAEGVRYDFVHILNHSFYKGSLFMLVGIVDHATGIRDIRRLGHLAGLMPLTALAFLLSVGAMAGFPGSTGFLSKELIIADLVMLGRGHGEAYIILATVAFASMFKVAFSLRLFYHIFVRKPRFSLPPVVQPSLAVHFSPLILSVAAIIFGLWPEGLNNLTQYFFVSGLHSHEAGKLAIWHGWTIELLISMSIIGAGFLFFALAEISDWSFAKIPNPLRFDRFFEGQHSRLMRFSKAITHLFQPTRMDHMMAVVIAVFVASLVGPLAKEADMSWMWVWPSKDTLLWLWMSRIVILFMAFAMYSLFRLVPRAARLIALVIVGLLITFLYILYFAPDLGLTQLLVEVFVFLLMLLMLQGMPTAKVCASETAAWHWLRVGLSAAFGVTMGLFLLFVEGAGATTRIGDYFSENSEKLAHGRNVVNTILVDFRGFDTLGEITVLAIAALGCVALLGRGAGGGDALRRALQRALSHE